MLEQYMFNYEWWIVYTILIVIQYQIIEEYLKWVS